jgi:radical SAM-linked protein
LPIGYSAGFSPHPKVSWVGAAPTGVASEAEYLEIGLIRPLPADEVRSALDAALPPGLDILDAVQARTRSLPERIDTSWWRIEMPGVSRSSLEQALAVFLAMAAVPVERVTKNGRREVDTRAVVVSADAGGDAACAILDIVVRHVTPAARPDDVLTALRRVAELEPPVPPRVTRLAQGSLDADGRLIDPFDADRVEEYEDGVGTEAVGTAEVELTTSGVPLAGT